MNDSAIARWSVLVLIALMMFFGYMFVDSIIVLRGDMTSTNKIGRAHV